MRWRAAGRSRAFAYGALLLAASLLRATPLPVGKPTWDESGMHLAILAQEEHSGAMFCVVLASEQGELRSREQFRVPDGVRDVGWLGDRRLILRSAAGPDHLSELSVLTWSTREAVRIGRGRQAFGAPDGEWVAVVAAAADASTVTLRRITDGRRFAFKTERFAPGWGVWSPDSSAFAYWTFAAEGLGWDARVVRVDERGHLAHVLAGTNKGYQVFAGSLAWVGARALAWARYGGPDYVPLQFVRVGLNDDGVDPVVVRRGLAEVTGWNVLGGRGGVFVYSISASRTVWCRTDLLAGTDRQVAVDCGYVVAAPERHPGREHLALVCDNPNQLIAWNWADGEREVVDLQGNAEEADRPASGDLVWSRRCWQLGWFGQAGPSGSGDSGVRDTWRRVPSAASRGRRWPTARR